MGLASKMANAPVHDLKIQARDKDLLIGTHGRSIYLADLSVLQQLDDDLMSSAVHVFDIPEVRFSSNWGVKRASYSTPTEPETMLTLWISAAGSATVTIEDEDGNTLSEFEADLASGLNYVPYDLTVSEEGAVYLEEDVELSDTGKRYLPTGTYTVRVQMRGAESTGELRVTERN